VTEDIWGWGTPARQLRAKRRAELILEGTRIGPSSNVVEIGCGTGLFTERFARSGTKIITVDLSPDLLALARQRNRPNVQFLEKTLALRSAGDFGGEFSNRPIHLHPFLGSLYDRGTQEIWAARG
jgi:SAM-dependent methyltransferase